MFKKTIIYRKDLITTESGLIISSTDLYLVNNIVFKNGQILKKGKKYFTFSEISLLQKEKRFAYGWRLPTMEELKQIADEFGYRDGLCSSLHMLTSLGLGLYGSISEVDTYNQDPEMFTYKGANCYGTKGEYYGINDETDKKEACILHLYSNGSYHVSPCAGYSGCSVRLVHDPL